MADTDQERPASSPCPSSSSSNNSSSSVDSSPHSSGSTSDGEHKDPADNGGRGDDQKEKKEDGEDGNSSDSSSTSDSSVEESEVEEEEDDDSAVIDANDDKDKTCDGVGPTDDDDSEESDGNSDLENSYPRLPPAPVDTLITFRQREAHKDLQLTEKVKQKVIADARLRHQERQQAQRSKKKTSNSKRQRSKSDVVSNKSTRLERRHSSTDVVKALQEQEGDEWMVDCSCGLNEKNYDDGTSMIECDSCLHWVHAKCADKQPETVAREKFLCFRCCWMFDCVCSVRRQPNHDDGQRMVECESCKTWQHTECVRIPMTEEPADDYRCPRCVRKARRCKSAAKGSRSRDRRRKQSHARSSRLHPKSVDVSPVVAVKVQSSARSLDTLTMSTRSHRSKRAVFLESSKMEKEGATVAPAPSSPPIPAVSPPSTPPPPASPPPPSVVSSRAYSGYAKHDRGHTKRRSERKKEHSFGSNALSRRMRCRSLGSCSSSAEKTRPDSSERKQSAAPSTAVTPSPRGKGFMLRGFSPAAARTSASSSRAADARPPLPLTPTSAGASSGNNHNSHNSHGRKRNVSSARDRLAKKLKIRKSSLR